MLIAQDLIGQPPRKRILRQSADSPPHALPGSRCCTQNILLSLVFSNFHIVGFCPLFMLWDFVHFLCCGILSCGILSCGILSCGILSRIRLETMTLIIDHMQMVLSVANQNYGFLKKFEKYRKKQRHVFVGMY